jgi:hypothetical protein
MKLQKLSSLLVMALLAITTTYAQSVDEIIAKHLDAIGGKDKLSGITSVRMETNSQIMGTDAPGSTTILNGKGFRNETEFNGQKIIQVYTDKGGWAVSPMSGDAQAMTDDQFKSGKDLVYIVPFLDYSSRGCKVELVGREKVGDANTYKIKLTNKDNVSTTYYIDPTNYYIVQVLKPGEFMGQPVDMITTYSDFKKTDYGWVAPQSMEINFGGQFSLTSKTTKVEVNPQVDAAVFEMKK